MGVVDGETKGNSYEQNVDPRAEKDGANLFAGWDFPLVGNLLAFLKVHAASIWFL